MVSSDAVASGFNNITTFGEEQAASMQLLGMPFCFWCSLFFLLKMGRGWFSPALLHVKQIIMQYLFLNKCMSDTGLYISNEACVQWFENVLFWHHLLSASTAAQGQKSMQVIWSTSVICFLPLSGSTGVSCVLFIIQLQMVAEPHNNNKGLTMSNQRLSFK